jgi:shikimate kinase
MQRLLLVGCMGSGKTTVGSTLARRWNWTFADVDAEVERSFPPTEEPRLTVSQIFERHGEPAFRKAEQAALVALLEKERVVVATGGGTVVGEGAMDRMLASGPVVWLQGRSEVLVQRAMAQPGRPLLTGLTDAQAQHKWNQLNEARKSYYKRATFNVDVTELTPDQVVDSIEAQLGVNGVDA